MYEDTKLKSATIISIIAHLFVLALINKLVMIPINFKSKVEDKKTIEISKVSQEFIKRLKTVGVKHGRKEFSMPLTKEQQAKDTDKVKITNFGEQLNLKKLRPSQKNVPQFNKTVQQKMAQSYPLKQSKFIIKQAPTTREEEMTTIMLKQQAKEVPPHSLKDFGALPIASSALRNTEFNISVVPPEGVSEDQLNSTEKIYFSFQKRTFETYVRSFISTYRDFMRTMPYIEPRLRQETHIMTGRVTFDIDGNIVSIKMLKWSGDDNIQKLFEETLKSIRSMPNPPNGLITNDKEFIIYYQLNINAN